MPTVITNQIDFDIGGKDVGGGKVLDDQANRIKTLGQRVKEFRAEQRETGELALRRIFAGSGDRAFEYLFNLGPQAIVSTFAFRMLGEAANGAAEHIKKVREGTEGVAEAILHVAE